VTAGLEGLSPEVEEILTKRNARDQRLADALKDVCWKATPFSTADDDSITSYLVPAGTLHRLMAQAQSFGADFHVTIVFRAADVER
jgi:hypothetical protein